MKIETKDIDGIKIVKITGQIRISTQNEFKDIMDRLSIESLEKKVILSLDGVFYLNSAGLGIIIDTYKKFKEVQGHIVLCNLMPDITKLFEVTKLNNFIEIFKNEEEAISRLNRA